jgi:hypothetical protein
MKHKILVNKINLVTTLETEIGAFQAKKYKIKTREAFTENLGDKTSDAMTVAVVAFFSRSQNSYS